MKNNKKKINDLLDALIKKDIPFHLSYEKGGKTYLQIHSKYFIKHSQTVELSTNIDSSTLISILIQIIEKENGDE